MFKRKTLDYIINKFHDIHGNKYNYSLITNYKNTKDKIKVICREHGVFDIEISHHIYRKQGCKLCGDKIKGLYKRKNYDDLCKQIKEKLPPEYSFNYEQVKNNLNHLKDKVLVGCHLHGEFPVSLNNLLRGRKCPVCKITLDSCAYHRNYTLEDSKHINCIFYVFKLFNKSESFYKIGISREINRRITTITRKYEVEEIIRYSDSVFNCVMLEQTILKNLKHLKYLPKINFSGKTECFKKESLKEIFKLINANCTTEKR